MADDAARRSWWGSHALDDGAAARWRIGPLTVWVRRRGSEWRIAHEHGADWLDPTLEHSSPLPKEAFPDDARTAIRFAFSEGPTAVKLTPVLADRSVVVAPQHPLFIPPGQSVLIFISTPLWVRLSFGDIHGAVHEVPTFRASDTWFGPPTDEGELCYATKSGAYLSQGELVRRPHRARTVVLVRNRAQDPLRVERLNLPVRHLSLYAARDATLWTERVTLDREADGDLAAIRISEGAPPDVESAQRLSGPREKLGLEAVVRAFEAFFKDKVFP